MFDNVLAVSKGERWVLITRKNHGSRVETRQHGGDAASQGGRGSGKGAEGFDGGNLVASVSTDHGVDHFVKVHAVTRLRVGSEKRGSGKGAEGSAFKKRVSEFGLSKHRSDK